MNNAIEWSDELGSRGRRPWLLLIDHAQDTVTLFRGLTISGLVVVRGFQYHKFQYHKNGKWSHTTYRLTIAAGVEALSGRSGWEQGTFLEGLQAARRCGPIDSWQALATALGVSVPTARRFLVDFRAAEAARLDEVEARLDELPEEVESVEHVTVSTRRARENGGGYVSVRLALAPAVAT